MTPPVPHSPAASAPESPGHASPAPRPLNHAADRFITGVPSTVAFVRGASLAVEPPAAPLICSGATACPAGQPIGAQQVACPNNAKQNGLPQGCMIRTPAQGCRSHADVLPCLWSLLHAGAVWDGAHTGVEGRVAVLGSSSMFRDAWLGQYSNAALLDWLLAWLQEVHVHVESCTLHEPAKLWICAAGECVEARMQGTVGPEHRADPAGGGASGAATAPAPDTGHLSQQLRVGFLPHHGLAPDSMHRFDMTLYWVPPVLDFQVSRLM